MNSRSIAPCGIICDICSGFQREKNKCVGCNNEGNKPNHCNICSIRFCSEKNGNTYKLCSECRKYPCRKIKDLDKRYKLKYGESIIENFEHINELGKKMFLENQLVKWTCPVCGKLLCVHKKNCLVCGVTNNHFPIQEKNKQ
jgi:hypothetical protein